MSARDMASRLAKLERAADALGYDPGPPRKRLSELIEAADAGMSDEDRVAGAEAFRSRFGTSAAFVAELKAALAGGDAFDDHSWQPGRMSAMACWVAHASLDGDVAAAV
jgi:hypothetical protein